MENQNEIWRNTLFLFPSFFSTELKQIGRIFSSFVNLVSGSFWVTLVQLFCLFGRPLNNQGLGCWKGCWPSCCQHKMEMLFHQLRNTVSRNREIWFKETRKYGLKKQGNTYNNICLAATWTIREEQVGCWQWFARSSKIIYSTQS